MEDENDNNKLDELHKKIGLGVIALIGVALVVYRYKK